MIGSFLVANSPELLWRMLHNLPPPNLSHLNIITSIDLSFQNPLQFNTHRALPIIYIYKKNHT